MTEVDGASGKRMKLLCEMAAVPAKERSGPALELLGNGSQRSRYLSRLNLEGAGSGQGRLVTQHHRRGTGRAGDSDLPSASAANSVKNEVPCHRHVPAACQTVTIGPNRSERAEAGTHQQTAWAEPDRCRPKEPGVEPWASSARAGAPRDQQKHRPESPKRKGKKA